MHAPPSREADLARRATFGRALDRRARVSRADLHREARRRLDVERLHPEQAAAVDALSTGRDALVVMPTGGGKSAIYQLAGALLDGTTLVVSPLIALQHDQLEHIDELDVGDAAVLNSTMGERERTEVLDRFAAGDLEFLFVAPEQLANPETRASIARSDIGLFVVDEAHCVSLWGHDFRPSYLELAAAHREFGAPVTLALTATASPPVRDDVIALLELRDPAVLVAGFDRPNIHLAVERLTDDEAADEHVLARAGALAGDGIIYTATRASAEQLAAELVARGDRAAAYHAGLRASERERVQAAFMAGDVRVVVATWAFGLGIDKPDVRWVQHHAVPSSVDALYQELGRSGRDGEAASHVLWFREVDLQRARFQGSTTRADGDHVVAVVEALRAVPGQTSAQLGELTKLSRARVAAVLRALDDLAALERRGRRRELHVVTIASAERLAERTDELEDQRKRIDETRSTMLRAYADANGCRRQVLLAYFAEALTDPCGNCDRCDAGAGASSSSSSAVPAELGLALQDRVRHASLGEGTLVQVDGDALTVLFDEAGYRTLAAGLVADGGLLERVDT